MPNAKVLSEKQAIVAELTEKLKTASSGVLVEDVYKRQGGAQGTAGPGHPAPPGSLVAGAPGRHGSERGGPAAWPPERTGQRSLGALCGRPDDGRRCDHDPERYETGIKTSLHWQTEANGGMFL